MFVFSNVQMDRWLSITELLQMYKSVHTKKNYHNYTTQSKPSCIIWTPSILPLPLNVHSSAWFCTFTLELVKLFKNPVIEFLNSSQIQMRGNFLPVPEQPLIKRPQASGPCTSFTTDFATTKAENYWDSLTRSLFLLRVSTWLAGWSRHSNIL